MKPYSHKLLSLILRHPAIESAAMRLITMSLIAASRKGQLDSDAPSVSVG
jgi:hypothetical protein